MESEEQDIKRDLFEQEVRYLLTVEFKQRVTLEEFKDLNKRFEQVKNILKDDTLHAKFLELKHLVNDLKRKIDNVDAKDELENLSQQIN